VHREQKGIKLLVATLRRGQNLEYFGEDGFLSFGSGANYRKGSHAFNKIDGSHH